MKEELNTYALAGVGIAKGLYEVYKPKNVEQAIETFGICVAIGGLAVAGYEVVKRVIDEHSAEAYKGS